MASGPRLRAVLASDLSETLSDLVVHLVRRLPRDISLTAASVLGTLERRGAVRLGDLASSEGVTQPSMSALVGHLERLGLIERRSDATDGRGVLVSITAAGRRYRSARRKTMTAMVESGLAELAADDLTALMAAGPALGQLAAVLPRLEAEP